MKTETAKMDNNTEISWIASLIEKIIEFVFGITVGAAVGWYGGKVVGGLYARYFEPAHMPDMEAVMRWWTMPLSFAKDGILIGAIGGILIIALIEYRTFAAKSCA